MLIGLNVSCSQIFSDKISTSNFVKWTLNWLFSIARMQARDIPFRSTSEYYLYHCLETVPHWLIQIIFKYVIRAPLNQTLRNDGRPASKILFLSPACFTLAKNCGDPELYCTAPSPKSANAARRRIKRRLPSICLYLFGGTTKQFSSKSNSPS